MRDIMGPLVDLPARNGERRKLADVSLDRFAHFVRTAAAYGVWNGSVEDQAAIGIELPDGKSGA